MQSTTAAVVAVTAASNTSTTYSAGKLEAQSVVELKELCLNHFDGYTHDTASKNDIETYVECFDVVYDDANYGVKIETGMLLALIVCVVGYLSYRCLSIFRHKK